MALSNLKKSFAGKAAAIGLGAVVAMTPLTGAFAEDANSNRANVAEISSSRTLSAEAQAYRYSEQNPGIAVVVNLGTHPTTPTKDRIREALTSDFQKAGLTDPLQFFFEQNDTPASLASFYYDGALDGPYGLGESRQQASATAQSYNFRKENGLLASISYEN